MANWASRTTTPSPSEAGDGLAQTLAMLLHCSRSRCRRLVGAVALRSRAGAQLVVDIAQAKLDCLAARYRLVVDRKLQPQPVDQGQEPDGCAAMVNADVALFSGLREVGLGPLRIVEIQLLVRLPHRGVEADFMPEG